MAEEVQNYNLHSETSSIASSYASNLHHPQTLHHGHSPTVEPTLTRKSSLRDKTLMVPRNKRRGLFSHLSIVPEYKDARNYPPKLKGFIVLLIAYASMMGPMGTSIIYPAITPITEEYHTSTIMVNVSVGIYLLSLGILPLWWSSLSELRGRRTVYVISFTLLFGFCIGTSLAPNISAFIVFRMLCGASSASVQSVGAGTISDLYEPEERGKNLGYYYLGALMAPLASPIIGSLLVSRWSWRSTQWFMVILAGVNVLLLTLLLPETLRRQDTKGAIAAILAERRKGVKHMDESTTEKEDEPDEPSISQEGQITPDNSVQEEEEEVERILTRTSEVTQYPQSDHYGDPVAPQITRMQSRDPKQAQRIREQDLQRWKSNIENELEQMETRKSVKTSNQQSDESPNSWKKTVYIYGLKPLKSLHFLRYPPVTLAIIFSAISFAILYFVNMTVEYSYSRSPYNFKPLYIGLLYIPNSVTYIFASIYGGKWVDNLLKKYKEKHGTLAPEARISWNVVTAVVTFPISLLIFGWCLDKKQHWVTPLVGTALFGYASMMTIGATVSYLVDSLPGRGATGVALNNLIRQIFASTAVFVTEPMLEGMGPGWAFTMLAFIVIVASGVLILLKKKGDYWRENYDLQKLYDLLD